MKFNKSAEGGFAKLGEDFKDGDILKIATDAIEQDGDYGTQILFGVRLPSGEVKNLSFNKTSRNRLIDVYGEESSGWLGKEVKVNVVKAMVSGKPKNVVYLCSPDQMMFPEEY